MAKPTQPYLFILYDARARTISADDAAVLVTAETEHDARWDSRDFMDQGAIWFQYDVEGKTLINERKRDDIPTSWSAHRAAMRKRKQMLNQFASSTDTKETYTMPRATIKIDTDAKTVTITMPLEPRVSKTGKMILLTDTGGNQETEAKYDHEGVSKSVYANINIGVYAQPK